MFYKIRNFLLKKIKKTNFYGYYIFNVPVLKKIRENNEKKYYILGICIRKKRINLSATPTCIFSNYKNDIIKHCQMLATINNNIILNTLRCRITTKKKIRVAFFVIWSSQFSASKIYELMKKDNRFDPFIIVTRIPTESIQDNRFDDVYEKSISDLSNKYDNVYGNYKNGRYIDYSNQIDIAFYHMIHPYLYNTYFKVPYLISKEILCLLVPYGFYISQSATQEMIDSSGRYEWFDLMYKVYVDTPFLEDELSGTKVNIQCLGYPKIDNLSKLVSETKVRGKRKNVILAPHQDLKGVGTAGNFLNTHDIYIQLIQKYQNVDFIFRPHPLWFSNLKIEWGEQRAFSYLNKILSFSNVKFSDEDDYYQVFSNSDAMIHDCGSFLPEYIFTSKPSLYLKNDIQNLNNNFNRLGRECLKHYYIGDTITDACNFIDNIVIGENDFMQVNRIKFLNDKLKMNYPTTSESIFDDIKNCLTMDDKL